jgi:hypothetical protein
MRSPAYVISGAFVLVGLAIAAFGLSVVVIARRSAAWPSVAGIITRSGITHGDQSHAPDVAYTYSVDGVPFEGNQIVRGPAIASSTEDYALRRIARYPVGTPVAVYYAPRSPSTAVLEPGLSKQSFVPLVFGLMFVSFGGCFGLLWWLCDV